MFSNGTKLGLKHGNPEAFKEVFRVLYPRLKGYCKLFVADEDKVEDIIQDSFLFLWENHKIINSEKSIESLIFVMVRNRCLNYLKNRRMESELITLDMLKFSELQYLYQIDLNEKEEKIMEEVLLLSFQEAVNSLPDKMKVVFVQCKLEGKKQKQVAKDLGISIKMVEKQIAKAKAAIGEQLRLRYSSTLAIISMMAPFV